MYVYVWALAYSPLLESMFAFFNAIDDVGGDCFLRGSAPRCTHQSQSFFRQRQPQKQRARLATIGGATFPRFLEQCEAC